MRDGKQIFDQEYSDEGGKKQVIHSQQSSANGLQ